MSDVVTCHRPHCGNEARYYFPGNPHPTYCGVCDIIYNVGRGRLKHEEEARREGRSAAPSTIFLVEQIYSSDFAAREALGAYVRLEDAKHFCWRRGGPMEWKRHDSHGTWFESEGEHGHYAISIVTLYDVGGD